MYIYSARSRCLEVKYRMHDELYPEVDEMGHHDIDKMKLLKHFYLI